MNLCREKDFMIDLMQELSKPLSGYVVGVELNVVDAHFEVTAKKTQLH